MPEAPDQADAGTTPDELVAMMQSQLDNGEMLAWAHKAAVNYLRSVDHRPVAPTNGDVAALTGLGGPLPQTVGNPADVLDALDRLGSPATTGQASGRFFGLVNGGVLPVTLAARVLADAWDQNAAIHAVSPIASTLEDVCEGWLRSLFGLPTETVAGFVSGSSMATVCGLAAARWRLCRRLGCDVNLDGITGAPRLRIITSRHAHSTIIKAVTLLGFGTAAIEWVDVDEEGRLITDALPQLDDRTIVALQAGNVNSGSFDPIYDVCERARGTGAWVHVDGAFGLWAAACSELAHHASGLELADSWSVDAHKTLNTPYDSGIVLCADPDALVAALQNSAPYLPASSGGRDGSTHTPELSRRTRAVEIWAALRYLGRDGVDALVLHLHRRAQQFADGFRAAGFDVVNDVVFNQVMVEVGDTDGTDAFAEQVRASGVAWVAPSRWFDKAVVRVSVCSWRTTPADVERTIKAFVAARDISSPH